MKNNEQRVFKNNGKRFEEDFKASFSEYVWTYRPPDTGGGMMARFTQESLADLIVYNTINGDLSLVELKSTLGTSVSFKPYELCMQYEKEKKEFDEWNAQQTADTRRPIKEEIKAHRKYLRGLYKETNQGMIKYHQIKGLKEVEDRYNGKIKSYIAFTFFKTNDTFLVPINEFYNHWKTTKKKSININELNELVKAGKANPVGQEYIRRTMRSKYDLSATLDKQ